MGVATLSLVKIKYPELAVKIDGFEESLKMGMIFAVSNHFKGYGLNSSFQRLEAAILLSKGNVPELLKEEPQLCPELLAELIEVKKEVVSAVENKMIINELGINLGNEYKEILSGLNCLEIATKEEPYVKITQSSN